MAEPTQTPVTFTPTKVHGAPYLQWRVLPAEGGKWRIEARTLPDGDWVRQSDRLVQPEMGHGTVLTPTTRNAKWVDHDGQVLHGQRGCVR